MKILKFGGSSVASAERIASVVDILKTYHENGEQVAVVFSAFGGITNLLIEMSELAANADDGWKGKFTAFKRRHLEVVYTLLNGKHLEEATEEVEKGIANLESILNGIYLIKEASLRTMDYVQSFGERHSAFIISKVLQQNGIPAEYCNAKNIIRTDDNFSAAKVDFETTTALIQDYFKEKKAFQIVTGFIGSTQNGVITTLGRGGSDYTAAILGNCLEVEAIEIWTDVDGVMTADPRKVKKAFTMPTMTYKEAMEMSHFGAKVIYPPTIQPALDKNILLYIKNTFNPTFVGTRISNETKDDENAIKGVSSISGVALITLQGSGLIGVSGIAGRLFGALARNKVNIILITQGSSEHSITFAVNVKDATLAKITVEEEFKYEFKEHLIEPLNIDENCSVVAIIGENMRHQTGVAGRLFEALGKNGINIVAIAQGSSELNISFVVNQKYEVKALNAVHEAFFLSNATTLHLFLVGVGLIGKTLLEQIMAQNEYLRVNNGIEIKVVGLANTKKMFFDEDGIALDNWKQSIKSSDEKSNLEGYIEQMITMNLPNSVFVDNTASDKVATFYEQILAASISISTPNKIATSSSYAQYKRLKSTASKHGVKFFYETNVGAGLPVITTLTNLISSGDKILKIEGVLSGSLSYIFNNFKSGASFHDIVLEAQKLGYTEPDPRTDLSGLDVRRKLLILARESGLPLEAEDVKIENILPEESMAASDVPTFFETLKTHNDFFTKKIETASKNGKVLRFIAALDNGKASISLQEVDDSNPFYNLSGSDNMIVFTTSRYKQRPLVIRGPGAGAEVTAAGVFAEIISIGNYLIK